jgi:hypothetical protein
VDDKSVTAPSFWAFSLDQRCDIQCVCREVRRRRLWVGLPSGENSIGDVIRIAWIGRSALRRSARTRCLRGFYTVESIFDVFAAEPENRIAREERGGGKTSVVGSPM